MAGIGWPESLWFVRHGESRGNVANDAARASRAARLDIDVYDVNVELTETGIAQARAVGEWLAELPASTLPTRVVVSPYARARATAELIQAAAGLTDLPVTVDERIRDREQGVLDRLTGAGLRQEFPQEAERRAYVGKFWYRPAGGESWADVALRMRAWLLETRLTMPGERVLVVTHDVPILIARYILEALTPDEATSYSQQLRNCSLTTYAFDPEQDQMRRDAFNDTTALDRDDDAPITAHG